MNKHLYTINVFLGLFVFSLLGISAQITFAQAPTESISISADRQFVGPNEAIEVAAESRLINLNNKPISWFVDGQTVRSGVGVQSISVTTGNVGESITVSFRVDLSERGIVERETTITPTEVDLIWEATNSYTPPLYRGKALNPGWGEIRAVAIPHAYSSSGQKHEASDLIYTWSYNGVVYGQDSGRGQTTFSFVTTPRRNRITVEIETIDGERVARETLSVPVTEPELVFYPETPTRGMALARALPNTITLTERELAVSASPYYFLAANSRAPTLEYNWEINNEPATRLPRKNVVTLRQRESASGQANVSLEVTDSSRIFPSVEGGFSINF